MTFSSFLSAVAGALRRAVTLSLPTIRKAGAMSPGEWLALSGHVIALVIALTSTIGIYNFGAGLARDSLSYKLLLIPLAAFIGIMLQIVIISCIKLIVRDLRRNPVRALLAGTVVLLMWSITVGASYGSYWNAMSSQSYEQRATEQTVNAAIVPLENARSRFATATLSLGEVSRHADAMMTIEARDGTSCGYVAGSGKGDRFHLRERQKGEAASHSASLQTLNGSLARSLGAMGAFNNQGLASAYREASDTLGNPAVGMARQWIGEQRAGFAGGFPINGAAIACADPKMVRLLDVAAASLEALPKVPANPPRVTQLSNTEGVMLSFARLLPFGKDDELVQDSDYIPLLFPSLIEFIMTALIVLGEMGRARTWSSGGDGHGSDDNPRRPINPALATFQRDHAAGSNALDLHDEIINHLIELEGAPTVCFAIPSEPGAPREYARKLLMLIARHDHGKRGRPHPLSPYRQRLPFADLPALVTAGWSWASQHVDIHLLPRTLADDARRLIVWQAEAELFPAA
ncbi:hypothetical protein [Novosphingobium sp.]|uniref:hypothetical protein n=1 Tax=Novosphingobium sp. TaxID=1874826 RepID=UPI00286E94D5|nr:hypothetical protein [Novosphingobium sp.]